MRALKECLRDLHSYPVPPAPKTVLLQGLGFRYYFRVSLGFRVWDPKTCYFRVSRIPKTCHITVWDISRALEPYLFGC